MNFFEQEIERYKRRIKRIEENPDPTKMASNKLLYELELDRNQCQLDSWKSGKPFAWAEDSDALVRAMGFENILPTMIADRAGAETIGECFDYIRAEGYPYTCCDRAVGMVPLVALGKIPVPAFLTVSNNACDNVRDSYHAVARLYNVPAFPISVSFEATDETLRYVTDQLGELISYVERVIPGAKYDEARLIELQEYDRIACTYYRQIHELRKQIPCPIDPRDAFRETIMPSYVPHPELCLKWLKAFVEELGERVEKNAGKGEEKLRTIWTVTGYNNDPAPFEHLRSRGVSLLMLLDGAPSRWTGARYPVYGDTTEYGRKLSPLEEVARVAFNCVAWAGLGDRWVDDIVLMARELSCDFVINFVQSGCLQTSGLARLIEEATERELGIPTLQLGGRGLLTTGYDKGEVLTKIDIMVDACLNKKRGHG